MSPLVFLNGWAMTSAAWQPLMTALGAGFEMLTDTAALPPNATVVGWSLGAMRAMELALTQPENVGRLILIGATPRFVSCPDWPHGLDAAVAASFSVDYERQPDRTLRRFLALQTLGDSCRRSLLTRLEAVSVVHTGSARPELVAGLKTLMESDLRAHIRDIRQPVCLIHGKGDSLMPCEAAHWLARTLRARLNVIENCGHAPLLSRPDLLAQIIVAECQEQHS